MREESRSRPSRRYQNKKIFIFLCTPLLGAACTNLYLQPTRELYPPLEQMHLIANEVEIPLTTSTFLASWDFPVRENQAARPDAITVPANEPKGLILQVHGNAQNMSMHFQSLAWLPFAGYELITFDYRGFGGSEGEATIENAVEDTRVAIRFVEAEAEKRHLKWALVGQSLGGDLTLKALEGLTLKNLGLLVIESSFRSYRGIAREKMTEKWWTWPLQWLTPLLISDAASPSTESLQTFLPGLPVVLIHSESDEVVPFHQGELLWQDLREPKEMWRLTDAKHLHAFLTPDRRYRKQLLERLAIRVASPTF